MALLGFFRRYPPIREVKELADFVDEQSAYLVQRYIYDYIQARTGPYSQHLLKRPDFMEEVNQARWKAYPLGLAMIGEMVEGLLRPHGGEARRAVLDPFSALVLGVFDRHDTPVQLGPGAWRGAREELAGRLDQISLHPPKSVTDIPEPYVERYFNMMPFDRKLLTNDVGTTRSYLRLTLLNTRDELVKRMNAADMATKLRTT